MPRRTASRTGEPALSGRVRPAESATRSAMNRAPNAFGSEFNGTWIADSSRAIVLHARRAFRRSIISRPRTFAMDCLERTEHQTHCPFKGNASYWTLKVGDKGGRERRMVLRGSLSRCRADSRLLLVLSRAGSPPRTRATRKSRSLHKGGDADVHGNPIASWLIEERPGRRRLARGVDGRSSCRFPSRRRLSNRAVDRHHSHVASANLRHRARVARRHVTGVRVGLRAARHPAAATVRRQSVRPDHPRRRWRAPPSRGRRRVKLDFPILRDLAWMARPTYVAMPFRFPMARSTSFPMTSFARGGVFSVASRQHLQIMPERWPPVRGPRAEAHFGRSPRDLPGAQHAGERVLEGQIKHGDGLRLIHAVIWFCDLRNSTNLSAAWDTATIAHSQSVLCRAWPAPSSSTAARFSRTSGDAVLAIFPIAYGDAPSPKQHDADQRGMRARRLPPRGRRPSAIAEANAARPDMPALNTGSGSTSAT